MNKRILELDVLRGIAALSVLIYHYTVKYGQLYHHAKGLLFNFVYGAYGFELFFVISGFVIFMTLHSAENGLEFVVKRFSRLYPSYWLAVFFTFTVVSILGLPGLQVAWKTVLANLTMFQQFFNITNVDGVYWTLEIELSFYIILLIIYSMKLLDRIEYIAIVWLFLQAAIHIMQKTMGLFAMPYNIETFFILKFAHFFIMGIIFYRIVQKGKLSAKTLGIIIACILVHGLLASLRSMLISSFFAVIFFLMIWGKLRFISNKLTVFFGTISYSLYLIHQNAGYAIIRRLSQYKIDPNIGILTAAIFSVGLASIITFTVEKPAQHFIKDRYYKWACKRKISQKTAIKQLLKP